MKTNKHVLALVIVSFAANVYAAKPPPPGPQDVNVVNTPNVTVTNPQTSVTVDNATPIPVNVQNQSGGCPGTQFEGFTTATFDGGQGIVTYTNACQQDYPGSWMCTSEEFLNTRVYPSASGFGWIRPTPVPMGAAAGSGIAAGKEFVGVQDASGLIVGGGLGFKGMTCRGWADGTASNDVRGLNVNAEGKYSASSCDSVMSVACCAPAP